MLKIHQPYKYKSKYILALSSAGVFLLGSLWFGCRLWELSSGAKQLLSRNSASAAGDWRTIHDIENMQEMNQQICSNTDEGDTAVLTDNRTGYASDTLIGSNGSTHNLNQYVVVKLKDGNCWMQENLRLPGGTSLNSSNSDVNSDWTLPPSATTSWNESDYQVVQMKNGVSGMTVNSSSTGDGKGWQPLYGNYYSWCAATAESCKLNRNGNAITTGAAAESICPRNWRLPTGGTNGELYNSFKDLDLSTAQRDPYRFSAGGYVLTGAQLYDPGNSGSFWSSTPSSDGNEAYQLYFASYGAFVPGINDASRYFGLSVRCVSTGGLDKVEKPIWQETTDTGINVTVPKVLTLDVSDGVNTTADAYNVVKGEIVAIVTSNNIDYEVLLSSEQPSLIGQKDSTNYIPVVSNTNPVEKGNNAWGILNSSNLYDPITTTPQQFYNTITINDKSTSHTYGVGISISPTLPADTYSTTVTVTASSK